MIALFAAAALQAAYPAASIERSAGGRQVKSASGFQAKGLGDSPEAAARAFLARFAEELHAGAPFELIARSAPGQAGAVRFARRLRGLPVFEGDVVVGVDAGNTVVSVNTAEVPARATGRAKVSREEAVRAAVAGLETQDEPRAERGFKAYGRVLRPVWRVELVATRPPGDFRSDVDAETGKLLFRSNLRVDAAGVVSGAPPLAPGR